MVREETRGDPASSGQPDDGFGRAAGLADRAREGLRPGVDVLPACHTAAGEVEHQERRWVSYGKNPRMRIASTTRWIARTYAALRLWILYCWAIFRVSV